jgi:hypothetical protein
VSADHPSDFARQLELAWAAGFFDGEGCTHLSKYTRNGVKHAYVSITIAQVERANLERWQKAVGVGSIGNARHHGGNTKPFYVLTVSSYHAKKALDAMWPYLGDAKKRQAEEAIRTGEIGRGPVLERGVCVHGHPLTPDNVYRRPDGRPKCKTCCLASDRRSAMKRKEKRHEHLRAINADDGGPQPESLG